MEPSNLDILDASSANTTEVGIISPAVSQKLYRKSSSKKVVQISNEGILGDANAVNLGDILRQQLINTPKINRSTETNFDWRVMAERWRQARIIIARTKPMTIAEYQQHYWFLQNAERLQETCQDEIIEVPGPERTDDWLKRMWTLKKTLSTEKLRAVRDCDKITDTKDLDIFPLDTPMSRAQKKMASKKFTSTNMDVKALRAMLREEERRKKLLYQQQKMYREKARKQRLLINEGEKDLTVDGETTGEAGELTDEELAMLLVKDDEELLMDLANSDSPSLSIQDYYA